MTIPPMGYSQDSSVIYMICAAIDNSGQDDPDESKEAVYRYLDPVDNHDILYRGAPISFDMISKSKGIEVNFIYKNYNLDELEKKRPVKPTDRMICLRKNKSFLSSAEMRNAIVMEDVLKKFRTKEQAWEWAEQFKGKRIYLYDSAEGLDRNGQIVLYQVRLLSSGRPTSGLKIIYP